MKIKVKRSLTVFLLMTILIIAGCVTDNPTDKLSGEQDDIQVDRIEVIHFHGTHQCYTCRTVGAYAEETVNTYFPDEVKAGKITFQHINTDLPENRDIVIKYGVKSSSLWIGVYTGNGFHPEENVNVWYKIRDKEDYMSYLKGIIEKRLMGDLS
jgi:frataxin-like iron-binding protein CyaY